MSSGVVESFMRHYFLVTVFLTQLFFWVVVGLVMESLKREWPFISVYPYRDPTQVPLV